MTAYPSPGTTKQALDTTDEPRPQTATLGGKRPEDVAALDELSARRGRCPRPGRHHRPATPVRAPVQV